MNIIFTGEIAQTLPETMSGKFGTGGVIALIGFLIVFSMLIIIIFAISIMSASISAWTRRSPNGKDILPPPILPSCTPDNKDSLSQAIPIENTELVAVITAAISVMMQESVTQNTPSPGFIVRRIQRTFNNN